MKIYRILYGNTNIWFTNNQGQGFTTNNDDKTVEKVKAVLNKKNIEIKQLDWLFHKDVMELMEGIKMHLELK